MSDVEAAVWSDPRFQSRRMVDLLCRQYEDQWRVGQQPSIEEYLRKAEPVLRDTLLPELIAAEWELRMARGIVPSRTDYEGRFPQIRDLLDELETTRFARTEPTDLKPRREMPEPGQEFCGYRIIRELGRGSMGTVYLAEVPVINHGVALKVLKQIFQDNSPAAVRFEREARLLSRLDHPGIVPLYSYGEQHGFRYLVMKAVAGTSLAGVLHGKGSAGDTAEILRDLHAMGRAGVVKSIAVQLATALKVVHDAGILHRDIKPSNILLSESGHVFLTDFSLARSDAESSDLTQSFEFVGTLRYAAPESIDGKYSPQSDIYSLGLVLFELVTLGIPFQADSRRELLSQKLSGKIPEFASWDEQHSPALHRIVRKMTACLPEERYASADDVLQQLQDLDRLPSAQSRIRWGHWSPVAGAILCLCLGMVALLTCSSRTGSLSNPEVLKSAAKSRNHAAFSKVGGGDAESLHLPFVSLQHSLKLPLSQLPDYLRVSPDGRWLMAACGDTVYRGDVTAGSFQLSRAGGELSLKTLQISEDSQGAMLIGELPQESVAGNEEDSDNPAKYVLEALREETQQWIRAPICLDRTQPLPQFFRSPAPETQFQIVIPEAASVRTWNSLSGEMVVVSRHAVPPTAIAARGRHIATAQKSGQITIQVWPPPEVPEVTPGTEPSPVSAAVPAEMGSIRILRFTAREKYLVAADHEQFIVIDSLSGQVAAKDSLPSRRPLTIAVASDANCMTVLDTHTIRTFDFSSMAWQGEPMVFSGRILIAVPWVVPGNVLVVEESGRLSFNDTMSGMCLKEATLVRPDRMAFSRKARRLVIAEPNGQLSIFQVTP